MVDRKMSRVINIGVYDYSIANLSFCVFCLYLYVWEENANIKRRKKFWKPADGGHWNTTIVIRKSANESEWNDMPKKLTTEEFVRRAKEVHGDKYDYSLSEYGGYDFPVKIICPIHGEFEQFGGYHLAGFGCKKCGNCEKHTTDGFIVNAKRVHGETYDYSKSVYNGNKVKVIIGCRVHGDFMQSPNMHLKGQGCPACGDIRTAEAIRSSKDAFIARANEVHHNLYDYSKVEYVGNKVKVEIQCPIHGPFMQRPNDHLSGMRCPTCHRSTKKTTDEFIELAKSVHGNLYDYSKVNYVGNKVPVTIICKKHGEFKKWPNAHVYKKQGCPICSASWISKCETDFLNHVQISESYRQFPIGPFSVDGVDKSTKTVYEFLGDYWHGNPSIYDKNKINKTLGVSFGGLYKKTFWRFGKIADAGYTIKYIWETDWKKWNVDKSQPLILQEFTRRK